jgi:hypothetical protein
MSIITILLNGLLNFAFDRNYSNSSIPDHYLRKFELHKLAALLPFGLLTESELMKAVEKFCQSSRFVDCRLTGVLMEGLMARRKIIGDYQSEFESVYVVRVHFGKGSFAILHIYEDGTWKEYSAIDHETGGNKFNGV